ncbi:hypothetical protein D9613_009086 [Agrocybe pediades]|uniref:BTB domain-containing protein n=1 Tax=Agrocybe pediades TaxID=84607 RepID=A0A8H4R483_9AGAR|nr:hypothetical protein D9613_009086 [Agrocybe pediades]
MDSRHYAQSQSYAQTARPEYPTPPPSFAHYRSSDLDFVSYDSFPFSSPASKDSYTQSSQTLSVSSPTQSDRLAIGTAGLTIDDEQETVVSISTAFNPNAIPIPDTLLSSSDEVIFYVHAQTIVEACPTAFQPPLSAPLSDARFREQIIQLDAPSKELNVILHTLYGNSPAAHSPDLATLIGAVDRMPLYTIPPKTVLVPTSPLYNLLLSQTPLYPLDIYALAAHHGLHQLAVSASSHLLSYDVGSITDDMALRMGAIYLKKLLLLHVGRFSALKAILLHPPHPHPPTRQCNFQDQRQLTRAWALTSAYFAWESRPGMLHIPLFPYPTKSCSRPLNPRHV